MNRCPVLVPYRRETWGSSLKSYPDVQEEDGLFQPETVRPVVVEQSNK